MRWKTLEFLGKLNSTRKAKIKAPDKSCLSFVNFDFESFYPSISLNLFQQAIGFAREKVDTTDTDISIIMQARKTLLFHDGIP